MGWTLTIRAGKDLARADVVKALSAIAGEDLADKHQKWGWSSYISGLPLNVSNPCGPELYLHGTWLNLEAAAPFSRRLVRELRALGYPNVRAGKPRG